MFELRINNLSAGSGAYRLRSFEAHLTLWALFRVRVLPVSGQLSATAAEGPPGVSRFPVCPPGPRRPAMGRPDGRAAPRLGWQPGRSGINDVYFSLKSAVCVVS